MSSVSLYHSEIKQDDEQNEKSQNEKGKKQDRVEINTSEISSRIDTGEDTFMSPRVAVELLLCCIPKIVSRYLSHHAVPGIQSFGFRRILLAIKWGIFHWSNYISCSCTQDSCDTCNEQRRDFLEALTLYMLQEIPAPAVPCVLRCANWP
jgi:hypothetical protein